MTQRLFAIRGRNFSTDGPEIRSSSAKLANSAIERRIALPPLVELNIESEGFNRDLRLDLRDKKTLILVGLTTSASAPEIIVSPDLIETLLLAKIERLRARLAGPSVLDLQRMGRPARNDSADNNEYAAKIEIMKSTLGLARDENGNWQKNPTELTHVLQIPNKFNVTTDHAIVGIGADGLTIKPLTNQEGWVSLITPEVYTFNIDVKPGQSVMVKFGFRW